MRVLADADCCRCEGDEDCGRNAADERTAPLAAPRERHLRSHRQNGEFAVDSSVAGVRRGAADMVAKLQERGAPCRQASEGAADESSLNGHGRELAPLKDARAVATAVPHGVSPRKSHGARSASSPPPSGRMPVASAASDDAALSSRHGSWYHRISPRAVLLLYALVAADACTLMVIGPFLPAFVAGRLRVPDGSIGFWVGVISGAYNLSNGIMSPYFGNCSDECRRRRPFLLGGVLASAVLTAAFPFTTRAWMATGVRLLTGGLNPNIALSKAYLADLTVEGRSRALSTDRAVLFGYLGAVWALARSFGSAVSGVLTGASIGWLGVDGARNAYAAPCLVLGAMLLLTFVSSAALLPESMPPLHASTRGGADDSSCEPDTVHMMSSSPAPQQQSGQPELEDDHARRQQYQRSLGIIARTGVVFHAGGSRLARMLVANAIHQFCNGGLLVAIVLFASLERARGGMGFEPAAVGMLFTHFGLVGLVFQLTVFGRILRRIGLRRLYITGASMLAFGSATVCLAAAPVADVASVRWVPLLALLVPISCGFMAGLPVLFTLITNAAPVEVQGLAQGVAQSSGGIARTFGPVLTGIAFSVGAAHHRPWVAFVMLATLYVVCAAIAASLDARVEHGYEAAARMAAHEPEPAKPRRAGACEDDGAGSASAFVIADEHDERGEDAEDEAMAERATMLRAGRPAASA